MNAFLFFRKGKKETRAWHVTFKSKENLDNTTEACFGMLINENWVLTRQACSKAYIPTNASNVQVKIGRRESRDVILNVDYVTESVLSDYDLRLVRLNEKSAKQHRKNPLPCILTHSQYHQLSRALAEGVFTTRFYKSDVKRWRLLAKRGKIAKKCKHNGDICVKTSSNGKTLNFQGSPLSLRYQGVWYLAGLGVTDNMTHSKIVRFTPLWTVNNWIATTIHEIENKCQFESSKKRLHAKCEGLQIEGVVQSDQVESV